MRLPTSTLRATLAGLQVTMTRPATAWALCATGLFAGALPAMGQSACFTIVSDTTTSIHVIGNTPALWGNEVAFYGTWPAALKHAQALLGLPVGVPREPVQPLAREQADKLRGTMVELGLLSADAKAAE